MRPHWPPMETAAATSRFQRGASAAIMSFTAAASMGNPSELVQPGLSSPSTAAQKASPCGDCRARLRQFVSYVVRQVIQNAWPTQACHTAGAALTSVVPARQIRTDS
jgi:hypothetical protein